MSQAVTCPICGGKGRIKSVEDHGLATVRKSQPCHGCGGKGWVEVGEDNIPVPYSVPIIILMSDPLPHIF